MDELDKTEALDMAKELVDIVERLEEIAYNWAPEYGFRAVTHKIEEATGRIANAAEAAHQYADGTLEPTDD